MAALTSPSFRTPITQLSCQIAQFLFQTVSQQDVSNFISCVSFRCKVPTLYRSAMMRSMDEKPDRNAIADAMYSHVFHDGGASAELLDHGRFPENWCKTYLELLALATKEWKDAPMWPRQLVAAVHFTSWYLVIRYDVWKASTGQQNSQTERELNSLRSPSEIFLMHGSLPLEP